MRNAFVRDSRYPSPKPGDVCYVSPKKSLAITESVLTDIEYGPEPLASPKYEAHLLSAADEKFAKEQCKFKCPACSNWIESWRRSQHLHEHEFYKFRTEHPNRLHTELRGCLYCPFACDCDSTMRGHLHLAHPGFPISESQIRGVKPLSIEGPHIDFHGNSAKPDYRSIDPAADLASQNIFRQAHSLDSTRDYAHAYREEGRLYGSHCSHDDYSDESSPDKR